MSTHNISDLIICPKSAFEKAIIEFKKLEERSGKGTFLPTIAILQEVLNKAKPAEGLVSDAFDAGEKNEEYGENWHPLDAPAPPDKQAFINNFKIEL